MVESSSKAVNFLPPSKTVGLAAGLMAMLFSLLGAGVKGGESSFSEEEGTGLPHGTKLTWESMGLSQVVAFLVTRA